MHFVDRQTNKQTGEQMHDSTDALSHFRCRKRRLNNKFRQIRQSGSAYG